MQSYDPQNEKKMFSYIMMTYVIFFCWFWISYKTWGKLENRKVTHSAGLTWPFHLV